MTESDYSFSSCISSSTFNFPRDGVLLGGRVLAIEGVSNFQFILEVFKRFPMPPSWRLNGFWRFLTGLGFGWVTLIDGEFACLVAGLGTLGHGFS
jgi:hypothetical protein